ncbi:uncharacterized protein ASPGLDRAFT_698872 [Aspergillus glaucus CBS 516.65]|uniref:Uncharacterized protein n=1 Tax=Aspergillus glaucus CBS 516.65 TaxID=1160497 RepID=A0A1L9VWQ0_ASPGL|nr:hypothetical protein ASPGLDRAFT_698872 [Aspergillus glaucus CBS 516.65]OJJ88341.1 hypothetical protein ASPGLDRAFT_698872 [Aspergillus glaucus CBS 516.65]
MFLAPPLTIIFSPAINPIMLTMSFPASILPPMSISHSTSHPFEIRPCPRNCCYPRLLYLLLQAFLCLLGSNLSTRISNLGEKRRRGSYREDEGGFYKVLCPY